MSMLNNMIINYTHLIAIVYFLSYNNKKYTWRQKCQGKIKLETFVL